MILYSLESSMLGSAVSLLRSRLARSLALISLVAASPSHLVAQNYTLVLPQASPAATVSQTIGLTTLSVDYHRPGVNKRVIWGGLEPYDSVWRAGANDNTVFASSSAFTIGGKTLPAGRYALFMIPRRTGNWTVILSNQPNAWGAFSYNQAEDAVRFDVAPKAVSLTERLRYDFGDPTANAVTLSMRWDKVEVTFPITVNTNAITIDSLRVQLRHYPRFYGQAWVEAASWVLANTQDVTLAEAWADTAIMRAPTFSSYNVKAWALDRQGKTAEADSLRQAHLGIATEAEMNAYGYQLVGLKKNQEALAIFIRNTKEHPGSWNTWDSLGEMYATLGDTKKAVANYEKALALTNDPTQKTRINGILAGLK
jgi:tetratricopeptide (TPR) repeat protein